MLSPRHFIIIPLLAATMSFAGALSASAQQVAATAQTIQAGAPGGSVDVQFRITVANGESSVASNVFVVFADGFQVNLGDVPAGGSVVSELQSQTLDTSATPTRSFPVPVTLKFTLDGANVELAQTLIVRLAAPAEQGQ